MPAIFQIIQARGGVPEAELYQVFNMGIGMTVIVGGGKGGRGVELHPGPETKGVAHRRSHERQGSRAGGLSYVDDHE